MHTSCPGPLNGPAGQPLDLTIWEGVHRALTREPGDLPALSLMLSDPGDGRGTERVRSSDEPGFQAKSCFAGCPNRAAGAAHGVEAAGLRVRSAESPPSFAFSRGKRPQSLRPEWRGGT